MREARVREPPVVVLFREAHRCEEARASGRERGERGVGEAEWREDECGDEVGATGYGGGETVCQRDPVVEGRKT